MPDFGRATGDGAARPLAYDGEGGALFRIVLRNTMLGLVTLGIYRFWGRTRLRRYLWAHVRLLGDRFEYTGTAMELFLGFLVALAVLIPIGVLSGVIELVVGPGGTAALIALQVANYALLGFLIGIALFRARRYRLTRTAWRGIRFGQSGASTRYALLWLGSLLLAIVTLGFAHPVGEVALQRFRIDHTWLGSMRFGFDGRARDLLGRWALCLLLAPITLGLSLIWYAALRTRYFAACTRLGALGFALPVRFGDVARIYVPWYLVLAVVFGGLALSMAVTAAVTGNPHWPGAGSIVLFVLVVLLLPALQVILVTHRMVRLVAGRLALTGDIDPESIVQKAQTVPRTGEGLADALDVGGGVEVGF